jgi:hypothetical protein
VVKLGAVAGVAMALVFAAPAAADVPPGFDLFETDPAATVFSFREEFTIPPNFFDQGSAAFQGDVQFGGLPLGEFMNQDVGDADTVVRRPEAARLAPPFPADTTIPIELVSLSLQSMQPIAVDVGGQTQLWDAFAQQSPTRPSQGTMRILQLQERGGAFDSQLQVFPLFTFVRLSDGETRTLDVGSVPLGGEAQQKLVLRSSEVPWRAGCVFPALLVQGLNAGFCPAQDVNGRSVVTAEEAPLARHVVRPAQRRLEHFGCYSIKPHPLRRRELGLSDQFGDSRAQLLRPQTLCAPAQKNREPLRNRRAHLECFGIRRDARFESTRTVAVRNQFGSTVLELTRAVSLCAPTSKSRSPKRRPPALPRTAQIDHFTCYKAAALQRVAPVRVSVREQFSRERIAVQRPSALCTPTDKEGSGVEHPVQHLVCYAVRHLGKRFRGRVVRVRNQFGSPRVSVRRRGTFCVPSLKVRIEGG